ncbi:MAG: polyprenyl diphosphate synthase [Mariprofundaceae bacterium]|nr:polyprenyl diphosphate synthase [Mariprofundaceae bacterium]
MTTQHFFPKHIGIIMDGNGRWAKQKGLPRLEGHRRGTRTTRSVIEWAADLDIPKLSLFVFSSENWNRPDSEVQGLMKLLSTMLKLELPNMIKKGVCLSTVGDIKNLPEKVQAALNHAQEKTKHNTKIQVCLCLNYGGQQEIIEGAKKAMQWALTQDDPQTAIETLSTSNFRDHLWSHKHDPVELIIRTGSEQRISNFLLWDAAYAELFFSEKFWPDFNLTDLNDAVRFFQSRQRRFGMIDEQVQGKNT